MADVLTDRRKLSPDELERVEYRAGLLFSHLPAVQTTCSREYLIGHAVDACELGLPVMLPGDGRTVPAERMLAP